MGTSTFKIVSFALVCYLLLCNYGYLHCINHAETNDYVKSCNKAEEKV